MKKFYNSHAVIPMCAMKSSALSVKESAPRQSAEPEADYVAEPSITEADTENGYVNGNIDVAAALEEYYRLYGKSE